MGAQKFNFAPKFPQNGNFQPEILYFGGEKIIYDKKKTL